MAVAPPRDAAACSCFQTTVQSSYKLADSVFVARVHFAAQVGNTQWYAVRLRSTFKGCAKAGQWVYVKTNVSSAACGVTLKKGQYYLLNAKDQPSAWGVSVVSINSCLQNKQVSSLSTADRKWLMGRGVCCDGKCACADGTQPVQCFVSPCTVNTCPAGECVDNYCGGCNAEFYTSFGEQVCLPCVTGGDCSFSQVCGSTGMCVPACNDDNDCNEGFWCRQLADSDSKECVPYQQEGETCGGFVPAFLQKKCDPSLDCADVPPLLPDLPGVCKVTCKGTKDCPEDQYCSVTNHCRDDGTCWKQKDCTKSGNDYPLIDCEGKLKCTDKVCGIDCKVD